MCGLVGIYSRACSPEQKQILLARMLAAIEHRGPDGVAMYSDEEAGIALCRLAIVDRACASPLHWNEDDTCVLALNGEIYNHRELRKQLSKHRFRSQTDAEVLLHAFEEWGIQSVQTLDGDFAFVFWDRLAKRGVLVRDRSGVKPLYYARIGDGLVFASELKALLAGFPELAQLSLQALARYLTHRFVPGPRTIFQKIMKLQPGCYLTFSAVDEPEQRRYWDYPREEVTAYDEEAQIVRGRALLEAAVTARLADEVAYGVLLSGGLDSSLLTAMAARASQDPLQTFSVVFFGNALLEESVSEHRYSRLVARTTGTRHAELPVDAELFMHACTKALYQLEEPIADPPAVLLHLLCDWIKQAGVTVLLSGEGADELFAGYPVYAQPRPGYMGMGVLFTEEEKAQLLSFEALPEPLQLPATVRSWDWLHQMLYVDCTCWLVDDLLLKADKMGMLSAVEIRVPFLDHRVAEYAFSLPPQAKRNGSMNKYLLRKIAEPYLPETIIHQHKRGFPLPLGIWLKGELRSWVEALLLDGLRRRGYFEPVALERLLQGYFEEEIPHDAYRPHHMIWALVTLELFLQSLQSGNVQTKPQ